MANRPPVGILLANTGTPDDPSPRAVRRFLREFLSDRRVINYPRFLWLPILHGIILNVRPQRSARLYRKIWTQAGSPLLVTTQGQTKKIREYLAARVDLPIEVAFGMRYGNPSLSSALQELKEQGVLRVLVLPLFPQFSTTTSASILDAVYNELRHWKTPYQLRTAGPYFDHPLYIQALANSVQRHWEVNGKGER